MRYRLLSVTAGHPSIGENFLYVFKGARSAPGPRLAADLGKRYAQETLTRARRSSRPSLGVPCGERCAPGRRLPLLGPAGHGGVGARPVPAAAAPAQRRNDQRQARELQERAILPTLQCEAGQDHAQGRFASHVIPSSPLRVIFPGSGWRLSEGWLRLHGFVRDPIVASRVTSPAAAMPEASQRESCQLSPVAFQPAPYSDPILQFLSSIAQFLLS